MQFRAISIPPQQLFFHSYCLSPVQRSNEVDDDYLPRVEECISIHFSHSHERILVFPHFLMFIGPSVPMIFAVWEERNVQVQVELTCPLKCDFFPILKSSSIQNTNEKLDEDMKESLVDGS